MTRRLLTAALALSMAGGVYLASAPAQASNMGFKLERDLDYKTNASGVPLTNIYWLSFPYFNGLGDVANSLAIDPTTTRAYKNKCVGEATGPTTADGWINVDDAICDLWTARITTPNGPAGTFSMTYFSRRDCLPQTRNANFTLGIPNFSGDLYPADACIGGSNANNPCTALAQCPGGACGDGDPSNNTDLWTDIGYQVNLTRVGPPDLPRNRAIIVGSHDPGFPGHPVSATPDCRNTGGALPCCASTAPQRDIVSVPYHTMFRKAVELLCGLEGVDWIDDGTSQGGAPAGSAGDGKPDALDECDTLVFDGVHSIAVSMYFNDVTTNGVKTCTVTRALSAISWSGCPGSQDFDLVPGEGYLYNILPTHSGTTTFLSPHF